MAKAKQSTQLPLDDMRRWRPVAEIVGRLSPIIGDKSLIAQDLTEALASEKIRCMRRRTNEHEMAYRQPARPESMPPSFWTQYYLVCLPNGDIRVALRQPSNDHSWIVNGVFYLWQPDCEEVWPELKEADASEAEASEPLRRKPGPRPKEEWQLFVVYKFSGQKYSGKPPPTAGELAQLCQEELGYPPAETAINKLLRDLQRLLG
jgi:hypothetical protein